MRNVLAVPLAITTILIFSAAHAQMSNLSNVVATPIPGAGHNYIGSLTETVNPANGSLSLTIPIDLPKGRVLSVPFALQYSSSGVYHLDYFANAAATWYSDSSLTGSGWSDSLPRLTASHGQNSTYNPNTYPPTTYTCDFITSYMMQDESGARQPLGISIAQVGAGSTHCDFVTNQPYNVLSGGSTHFSAKTTAPCNGCPPLVPLAVSVANRAGTVYSFSQFQAFGVGVGSNYYSLPQSIEDRNGNRVTISWSGNGSSVVTDSMGRTAVSTSSIVSNVSTVSVSGLTDHYTLNWQPIAANFTVGSQYVGQGTDCCRIPPASNTAKGVQSITLPNGKVYHFEYDATYGVVNKIVYPTGGYVSYTWGLNPLSEFIGIPEPGQTGLWHYDVPAIIQRVVSFDGVNVALKQTFSYSTTWAGATSWGSKQTTVTTQDLVRNQSFQTVYTYTPVGVPDQPNAGGFPSQVPVEQSIVTKDFAGAVARTSIKGWFNQDLLGCELSSLENNVTAATWYSYSWGQLSDKKEYDYSQVVAAASCDPTTAPVGITPGRETVIAYQTFSNTPIFPSAPSIQNRPSSVLTYGGSSRVAETDYGYDQVSLTPVTAVAHDDTNYGAGFNIRGNLTTRTEKCFVGATACTDVVTKYTYDQTGQLLSLIDPCGNTSCSDMIGSSHTTSYSYTDNYQPGSGTPSGNTNAYVTTITHPTVNGVTAHEYFQYGYSDSQLTSAQDDNQKNASKSNAYTYSDTLRRLTQTDFADGGRVTISYDDTSPSPSITKTTLIDSAAGISLGTKTIMDGLGHVVQGQTTTDPEGTGKTDTTYDGMSRVRTQSNPYRTGSEPTSGSATYT